MVRNHLVSSITIAVSHGAVQLVFCGTNGIPNLAESALSEGVPGWLPTPQHVGTSWGVPHNFFTSEWLLHVASFRVKLVAQRGGTPRTHFSGTAYVEIRSRQQP